MYSRPRGKISRATTRRGWTRRSRKVEQTLHKLAETLYKADAQNAAGAAPEADDAAGAGKDDDVIDAEFTEEAPKD